MKASWFPHQQAGRSTVHKVALRLLLTPLLFFAGMAQASTPAQTSGTASPVSASVPAPPAFNPADRAASVFPHKATYRLELESTRNNSPVRGASGMMTSAWRDACQGWTMEQSLAVNFTYDEGNENALTSTFTTWESKDGTRYRFTYRRSNNGILAQELRGSGELDHSGGKGKAVFTVPEAKEVNLPAGSYFPTAHTLMLMDAGLKGQPYMVTATLFDGSDEEGLSEVSAVMGLGKPLMSETLSRPTLLPGQPAVGWPLRMAFFPVDKEESAPEYEMDTNLLPNGVSEFMLMDYGDFKLRGTLDKLEPLPKPNC